MGQIRAHRALAALTLFGVCGVYVLMSHMAPVEFTDWTRSKEDNIDWRNLIFASTEQLTYALDSKRCRILAEDPLSTEWRIRLFNEPWLHCKHPHDKRRLFETVVSKEKGCPSLRESILRLEYRLAPEHVRCEYFDLAGIASELVQLQFGKGKPLRSGECLDAEAIWIICELGANLTRYDQPLLLAKAEGAPKATPRPGKFNVLVLQVDSMSRLTVHRTMPNTQMQLETIFADRLIQLFGYNKVGDSPATLSVPLLTGAPLSPDDVKRVLLDNQTRFIWQDFSDHGYRTMFLEELPSYSIFQDADHERFRFPRTDYFLQRSLSLIENAYDWEGCVFGEPMAKIMLDYVHDAIQILTRRRPLFAYVRLSRLTGASLSGGLLLDDSLAGFFSNLQASGTLEHTIVFFISDHGFSSSKFSLSRQGRIEEMLPFGFILPPEELLRATEGAKRLRMMTTNSQRLMTNMDIFATLVEIATGDAARVGSRTNYGISLFSREIPLERTCDKAGIFGAYCSCYNGQDVSSPLLEDRFRQLLLDRINHMLDNDGEIRCARFVSAETLHLEQMYEGRMPLNKFRLRARMTPPAEFEGLFEKLGKSAELEFVERRDETFRRGCARRNRNEQICYCAG